MLTLANTLNVNQNQLLKPVIDNESSEPASGVDGELVFDTSENRLKIWYDSAWHYFEVGPIFSVLTYDAGNGCWVKCTKPGATFSKSGNLGTLVVPEDSILLSATVSGVTADTTSGVFEMLFDYTNLTEYNNNVTDFDPPNVRILNTYPAVYNSNTPTDTFSVIYENSSNVFITQSSSGELKVKTTNLGGLPNWTIKYTF